MNVSLSVFWALDMFCFMSFFQVFGESGYLGLDETVKCQLKDKFDDMEVTDFCNHLFIDI